MKKLTTVSLFIFGVIVTAVLVAGLVFYQDKKINATPDVAMGDKSVVPVSNNTTTTIKTTQSNTNTNTNTTNPSTNTAPVAPVPPVAASNTMTLNMAEIAKHNSKSDCWLLISGKVYDITDYFGSHPGGNSTMAPTCGEDATAAYATQNPNATGESSRSAHSGKAKNLLNNYYVGDFNKTINL